MHTKVDMSDMGEDRIVYVRPVEVADLPSEVREQAGDADTIYAVHNSDGERLALVADKQLAYVLADENDLTALAVH